MHILIIHGWSRLNFLPHSLSLSFTLGDSLRSLPFLLLVLFSLQFGNQLLVLDFLLNLLLVLLQGFFTGPQPCQSCRVLLRLSSLRLRLGWRVVSHATTGIRLCLRLLICLFLLFEGFGTSFGKQTSMFAFFIIELVGSGALDLSLL